MESRIKKGFRGKPETLVASMVGDAGFKMERLERSEYWVGRCLGSSFLYGLLYGNIFILG